MGDARSAGPAGPLYFFRPSPIRRCTEGGGGGLRRATPARTLFDLLFSPDHAPARKRRKAKRAPLATRCALVLLPPLLQRAETSARPKGRGKDIPGSLGGADAVRSRTGSGPGREAEAGRKGGKRSAGGGDSRAARSRPEEEAIEKKEGETARDRCCWVLILAATIAPIRKKKKKRGNKKLRAAGPWARLVLLSSVPASGRGRKSSGLPHLSYFSLLAWSRCRRWGWRRKKKRGRAASLNFPYDFLYSVVASGKEKRSSKAHPASTEMDTHVSEASYPDDMRQIH